MTMVDINKKFAEILGILLNDEKRCTQTELGNAVGLKQPTISGIIGGTRTCNYEKRLKIASYFGMTMDEFLDYNPSEKLSTRIDKEYLDIAIQTLLNRVGVDDKKAIRKVLDYNELKNAKHHKIVDQFEQPKLAEEINAILLEIEKIKKVRLKKIKNILQAELDELLEEHEQDASKKRTANGED